MVTRGICRVCGRVHFGQISRQFAPVLDRENGGRIGVALVRRLQVSVDLLFSLLGHGSCVCVLYAGVFERGYIWCGGGNVGAVVEWQDVGLGVKILLGVECVGVLLFISHHDWHAVQRDDWYL